MKAYLLVFDSEQISRREVIAAIDRMPTIENRYAFFGNTLCVGSREGAKTPARRINRDMPRLRYVIAAVEPDQKGGRIPRSVLAFPNEPRAVEAEKETS